MYKLNKPQVIMFKSKNGIKFAVTKPLQNSGSLFIEIDDDAIYVENILGFFDLLNEV